MSCGLLAVSLLSALRSPRPAPAAAPAATDIHGRQLSLAELAGKVTLVVNVASQCGYTGACAAACLVQLLPGSGWMAALGAARAPSWPLPLLILTALPALGRRRQELPCNQGGMGQVSRVRL